MRVLSPEQRTAAIDRLFTQASVQPAPDNASNCLREFNIRQIIKLDPFVHELWHCRSRIVRGEPLVPVPASTAAFFAQYARGISSISQITVNLDFPYDEPPHMGAIARNAVVMYSGGSESVFMDLLFQGAELLRVSRFFPHTKINREFQLALVGLTFGYGVTNIGCSLVPEPVVIRDYEYSSGFIQLWNATFAPYTLQLPLGYQRKTTTFETLLSRGYQFSACDIAPGLEHCGRCWHCAEAYYHIMALKTRPAYADFPQIEMDPQFLQTVQRGNRAALKAKVDPFAATTNGLRALERDYGIVGWRKGDPTKPFG